MTNSSSKSPPSYRLRRPTKTITTLKKGQSQNGENKTEKTRQKQNSQNTSPYRSQQKRTNSRQRAKNSSFVVEDENKNIVTVVGNEKQQQRKVKNPLRKADSVGSISSNIAATDVFTIQQQLPPPPDPTHSSNVRILLKHF